MNEHRINGKEKLWKIEISRENNLYTIYVVSVQKPLLIFESYLGKLRRMFEIFPAQAQFQQPPVFYISSQENATVERVQRMHGFKLQEITSENIVLSINNPKRKNLYEISLLQRKTKGFFKKKYILAADKREAIKTSEKFKKTYTVKVKKAKKIDCYPILQVTDKRIILEKVKIK